MTGSAVFRNPQSNSPSIVNLICAISAMITIFAHMISGNCYLWQAVGLACNRARAKALKARFGPKRVPTAGKTVVERNGGGNRNRRANADRTIQAKDSQNTPNRAPDPEIKRSYETMEREWLALAKRAEEGGGGS